MLFRAKGSNVRSCLAAARKVAGFKLQDSREVLRSGGEDGLHRVHLSNGAIVECTVQPGASAAELV